MFVIFCVSNSKIPEKSRHAAIERKWKSKVDHVLSFISDTEKRRRIMPLAKITGFLKQTKNSDKRWEKLRLNAATRSALKYA